MNTVVVVKSLSHFWLFMTLQTAAHQASLSFTISQSLLKLMSIVLVMPFNHLIPVIPFSSCLPSFPESGSFVMSQLFTSGGQSIGSSASASVLPMNIQGWSPLGRRIPKESSPTPQFKSINSLVFGLLYGPTLLSTMTTGKTISLTIWTFVSKVNLSAFKYDV